MSKRRRHRCKTSVRTALVQPELHSSGSDSAFELDGLSTSPSSATTSPELSLRGKRKHGRSRSRTVRGTKGYLTTKETQSRTRTVSFKRRKRFRRKHSEANQTARDETGVLAVGEGIDDTSDCTVLSQDPLSYDEHGLNPRKHSSDDAAFERELNDLETSTSAKSERRARLCSVSLSGFKSYRDNSDVTLKPGLSVVVGKNGGMFVVFADLTLFADMFLECDFRSGKEQFARWHPVRTGSLV